MEKPSVALGWNWFKQGVALFRRRPAELTTLFLAYLFLMLGISLLPMIGWAAQIILMPAFSIAFLEACVNIEQNRKIYPGLLMAGFRSPHFSRLLKLGVLYLIAVMIAVFASSAVDDGMFLKAVMGQVKLDPESLPQSRIPDAMLFTVLLYLPVTMALWYAAPLIAWQGMNVPKAVFYSFFAVWRHLRAFLGFGLALLLFGMLVPTILGSVVALFAGEMVATLTVMMPLVIIIWLVTYCSFYATYAHVFGARPQADTQEKVEADR